MDVVRCLAVGNFLDPASQMDEIPRRLAQVAGDCPVASQGSARGLAIKQDRLQIFEDVGGPHARASQALAIGRVNHWPVRLAVPWQTSRTQIPEGFRSAISCGWDW